MRRVWLLALLVAPVIARAQTTGQILFDNGRPDFPNFVNATDCAQGGSIKLAWTVTILSPFTGLPTDGKYTVYASNQAPVNNTCFTGPNTSTGLQAGSVGVQIAATGQTLTQESFDPLQIVSVSGRSCNTSGDQTIFMCVQGTGTEPNTNISGNFGFATGTLTLSVAPPPPPKNISVTPGDTALNVSWDAGDATTVAPADSLEYQVDATVVGTTTAAVDPTPVHTSALGTATDLRLTGLVNTVVYDVRVYAFSKAGNRGEPSDPVQGSPEFVNDFFDTYKAAGGREQGGCASGAGAAVALGLLGAALLVLRRRK